MLIFICTYILGGLPRGATYLQTNETISAGAEDCCSTYACSTRERSVKAKQNLQGKTVWR